MDTSCRFDIFNQYSIHFHENALSVSVFHRSDPPEFAERSTLGLCFCCREVMAKETTLLLSLGCAEENFLVVRLLHWKRLMEGIYAQKER